MLLYETNLVLLPYFGVFGGSRFLEVQVAASFRSFAGLFWVYSLLSHRAMQYYWGSSGLNGCGFSKHWPGDPVQFDGVPQFFEGNVVMFWGLLAGSELLSVRALFFQALVHVTKRCWNPDFVSCRFFFCVNPPGFSPFFLRWHHIFPNDPGAAANPMAWWHGSSVFFACCFFCFHSSRDVFLTFHFKIRTFGTCWNQVIRWIAMKVIWLLSVCFLLGQKADHRIWLFLCYFVISPIGFADCHSDEETKFCRSELLFLFVCQIRSGIDILNGISKC